MSLFAAQIHSCAASHLHAVSCHHHQHMKLCAYMLFYCRVKTNPKNAINEHFLPRFLDFIVWGHEHECIIDPQV